CAAWRLWGQSGPVAWAGRPIRFRGKCGRDEDLRWPWGGWSITHGRAAKSRWPSGWLVRSPMRLRGAAARSKSVRTYTAWQRPTRRSRTIGSDAFAVLMVGLGQGSLSTEVLPRARATIRPGKFIERRRQAAFCNL